MAIMAEGEPFRVIKPLGEGGYGMIQLVVHTRLGTVAYKTCPGASAERQAELMIEADQHRTLRHQNIVILYEAVFNSTCCGLFLEYMKYGTVTDFIQLFEVPPAWRIQIIYEVSSGILYLHGSRPSIIHGDLSSQNILIGDGFHAKIADFGLSRTLKEDYEKSKTATPLRGKIIYIAPEYFTDSGRRKSEKFDVYGFAISAWEILSQKRAYHACSDMRLISIYVERGERPDMSELGTSIPNSIKQLIVNCWQENDMERPDFVFIKDHLFDHVSKLQSELKHANVSLMDQERMMHLSSVMEKSKISNTGTVPLEAHTQEKSRSTHRAVLAETMVKQIVLSMPQLPKLQAPDGYDQARIDMFTVFTNRLLSSVDPTWWNAIGSEFRKDYFRQLCIFLFEENMNKVYPPPELVFAWTRLTPISNIRVVIIGQDPYFTQGQANGLAFSVPKGFPIPRSLTIIYNELKKDIPGFVHPGHGDLTGWAQQGVLLLNGVLTVRDGLPNSHKKRGWETFTDAVISWLTLNKENMVFMLWGKYAEQKGSCILNHHVLRAPNPASRRGGFSGCKHFSLCNRWLVNHGLPVINWNHLNVDSRQNTDALCT